MAIKVWNSSNKKLGMNDLNGNFSALLSYRIVGEDLTALTNSSSVTFATGNKFRPTTLCVYLAAATGATASTYRKRRGGSYDYIENLDTDGNGESLTFNSIVPDTGTILLVDYEKAAP